jgi:hypothetical protein
VVDDGGGPGDRLRDIQQAVNAGADGATIRVQDGHYDGFTVLGKGLQVVAAQGADVSIEGRRQFSVRPGAGGRARPPARAPVR